MELISVIVPAYNAEQTIDKCLKSVLGGAYTQVEIIVVNDGSTDRTREIVTQLAETDSRIKLINQENTGVAGARNTGLRNATGKYIAWCDADDWVEPDWLESLYAHITKYDADIAVCRCQIDGRPSVNTGEVELWDRDTATKKFLEHKQLNGTLYNKLFRHNIKKTCQFDETLSYFEDDGFFWDALKNVASIVRFHEEKYHFVVNPNSLTAAKCNDKRVRALSVWEAVAADCENTVYEYAAESQLTYQYFNLLLAMYRSGYHDEQTEGKIRKTMRKHWSRGIRQTEGVSHKLFYCVAAIHTGVARWLYDIVMAGH